MKTVNKGFLTILLLIGITSGALAYMSTKTTPPEVVVPIKSIKPTTGNELVTIDTKLVQDKILQGSDGEVAVALTLTGANLPVQERGEAQPVDLVVVLDRSGSMGGQKINDARNAVVRLIHTLGPQDRMAIITYSNTVELLSSLTPMSPDNRAEMSAAVHGIQSGGGTNLGGGLRHGIATLLESPGELRQRKVILISDGLANQGVTDPRALGAMAANGVEHNLGVSTVGVGYDFNELLMTTIADHGAGNYYFLENPSSFAKVFEKEFRSARNKVADALEVRIPLRDGIRLVDAGGFPITLEGDVAVIHPGDLLAGQTRKLFLSYKIPTNHQKDFSLGKIQVRYQHGGEQFKVADNQLLTVTCIEDQQKVIASIDKDTWAEQVVKDGYNKVKNDVATAIRNGRKEEAMKTIAEYEEKNQILNSSVGSALVAKNLEGDVQDLRQSVEYTFSGTPAVVAEKKKQQAKVLQYDSYKIRRDKK